MFARESRPQNEWLVKQQKYNRCTMDKPQIYQVYDGLFIMRYSNVVT